MNTGVTDHANGGPENGDKPAKQKFGLVLQGGGALGAYEVSAVEYLHERGMECAIVSGASAGAMNAATLAGATRYPPQVPPGAVEKLAIDSPIPFLPDTPIPLLPRWLKQLWSYYVPSPWVPNMYRPRLDFWNLPTCTSVAKPTFKRTLEDLLDWDQVRDPEHMRLSVSASGVENGEVTYFRYLTLKKLPPGGSTRPCTSEWSMCRPAGASRPTSRGQWSGTGPTGMAA